MVPIYVGTHHLATEKHQRAIQNGYSEFTLGVFVTHVFFPVLGPFRKQGAQFLLFLAQNIDAKPARALKITVSMRPVGDAYQHHGGL